MVPFGLLGGQVTLWLVCAVVNLEGIRPGSTIYQSDLCFLNRLPKQTVNTRLRKHISSFPAVFCFSSHELLAIACKSMDRESWVRCCKHKRRMLHCILGIGIETFQQKARIVRKLWSVTRCSKHIWWPEQFFLYFQCLHLAFPWENHRWNASGDQKRYSLKSQSCKWCFGFCGFCVW